MSVHSNKNATGYEVKYRDGAGKQRSRTFRRKRDAERFDLTVKTAKQTGALPSLNGGRETLDQFVEHTWAPVHAAQLADNTRRLYVGLYAGHISKTLGSYELRQLTPEVIGRWQASRLVAGAPLESTRKALTLLGGILQRALEAGRIASNPQRLVRKAPPPATDEVRPLSPSTVEAVRAALTPRDAMFVSLLAYAGLRPGEARALRWGHVGERTLTVHAPKTRRHRSEPRSVRLLTPLAQDLREWRLLSGRPSEADPVIPAHDGGEWTEVGYEQWIKRAWGKALIQAGLAYQRPYDCRHSFVSLLLHEGRSVIYVARQLGHGAQLTMRTYGHVIEELDEVTGISAEDAIMAARRGGGVRPKFGAAG